MTSFAQFLHLKQFLIKIGYSYNHISLPNIENSSTLHYRKNRTFLDFCLLGFLLALLHTGTEN